VSDRAVRRSTHIAGGSDGEPCRPSRRAVSGDEPRVTVPRRSRGPPGHRRSFPPRR
jgi:hypothetical protein